MSKLNLDAEDTAFFSRELEQIKSKSYDVIKAPLSAFTLLPVSNEAGPGAETITYRQYDQKGMAKILANHANDLPRVDVSGKEFSARVKSVGASFGYSLQEIRAARMANKSLEQRKANAAVRAHRVEWNRVAFYGDSDHNLQGWLTNPNIPTGSVPNGASGQPEFSNKTPDEILTDLNDVANSVVVDSNGAEKPDTLVMPLDQYSLIASTARSSGTDTTILQFFLQSNPYIQEVIPANELSSTQLAANGITSFTGDVMIAYRKDPDALTLEMPQMYEERPVQEKGLEFEVNTHSRIGGVLVYYPLSMAIRDSI